MNPAPTSPPPATAAASRPLPWSKRLLLAGAPLFMIWARRHWHRAGTAVREQDAVWRGLAARLARTRHWRAAGVRADTTGEVLRTRVAPQTYETLAPQIECMKRGEADVLWPGRCAHFAVSSGTTAGPTKFLPITREMLGHFRQTGLGVLTAYAARTGRSDFLRGRHLFLGGATALTPIGAEHPPRAWAGDLSGITAREMPGWVNAHLYEPGAAIAQMADWPAKLDAIVERTHGRDITLLAGIPSWVLILAARLSSRAGRTVPEIWPHLECLVHGGVPIAPFAAELRAALGPAVNFHEVYPASEGFIAVQDADAAAGLRLFTGAGIYFEFLPMEHFDETRLAEVGDRAVPLSGVQLGVDYALLLTTPAGLVRYVIGDRVRFTSLEPPRLIYVGRTRLQLSAFGEHVIEKEITDALTTVSRRHGAVVANFHVAPIFADTALGRDRGRHEWIIELKAGTTPAMEWGGELDAELQRLNDDYAAKRQGGGLAGPLVTAVPAGTFEQWMRRHGKWGGQHKLPRCRSDRQLADDLAAEVSAPTRSGS